MDATGKEVKRLRSWVVLPLAVATLALAGCAQWDIGSVGNDGEITSAAVDPDNLCDWNHYTNYTEARAHMAVSCKSSRQVYTTCDIWLWPIVGSAQRVRTHGSQRCSASAAFNEYSLGAMGSIGTIWMRLDNPRRNWRRGFRTGSPIDCDIYQNSNSQSILECSHLHGRPGDPGPS